MLSLKPSKITVFGAGVWGSVIAQHLAKKGYNVTVWEHFEHIIHQIEKTRHHPNIPNFKFDDSIQLTASLPKAAADAELLILAIASKTSRQFARDLKPLLNGRAVPLISACKGLEAESLFSVCEIMESEIPQLNGLAMAFSGPSFALEVARNVPTKIVLAGSSPDILRRAAAIMHGTPISVETSSDRRGVELGGALKNVLAIGCGIIDGMGGGANTKAALITCGMREMAKLMQIGGGKPETVYGLAGLGDFILTGTSEISRNRRLGEKLGKGKAVAQARGEISTVAEGADSVESVHNMSRKLNADTPIINAVWQIMREGQPPEAILKAIGFN